jgi:hypothetical protein
MLLREFAPGRIAGECAKLLPAFRFEDVNAHGFGPFRACDPPIQPSISGARRACARVLDSRRRAHPCAVKHPWTINGYLDASTDPKVIVR